MDNSTSDSESLVGTLNERRIAVEEGRLALEQKRADYEQENRRAERDADQRNRAEDRRLREIELANLRRGITAPQATAIAAAVSLIGAAIGAVVTGYFTLTSNVNVEQQRALAAISLEREKFETELITTAVKTNNPLSTVPILRFYATAGLIPTYEVKILALADKNEGSGIPVTHPIDVSQSAAFLIQSVAAACAKAFDTYKTDAAGFVRAVAGQFGVTLDGSPDQIIDAVQGSGWEVLPDGVTAAARARDGYLVIGGLKGSAQSVRSPLSQVVVVVDGPLAAGKYPTAFWGNAAGNSGNGKTVNWAWTSPDRDHIVYAARPLNITAAR